MKPDELLDKLAAELDNVSRNGREGWKASCPAHDDRNPSFTFRIGKTGALVFHCHSGCTQEQLLEALAARGLWNPGAPVPDDDYEPPEHLTPQRVYIYRDPASLDTVAEKARFVGADGKKTFRWRLPGEDKWGSLQDVLAIEDLPLYGGHFVSRQPDKPVFLVEGEKAAEACWKQQLVAVTFAGGASQKKFGAALDILADRDVVLWPDNDDIGRELMTRIEAELEGKAKSIRWVTPGLPEKGDAADYFASGKTGVDILGEAEKAKGEPWYAPNPSGYTIFIPKAGEVYRFDFEQVDPSTKATVLSVVLTVSIQGKKGGLKNRLNAISMSGKAEFIRSLNFWQERDKGFWQGLLNDACDLLEEILADRDPVVRLSDVPISNVKVEYLFDPLVRMNGPQVFYGMGGSAKTYVSHFIGIHIAMGWDLWGQETVQRNVLYVDYEDVQESLAARQRMILNGLGEKDVPEVPMFYYQTEGWPLGSIILPLKKAIKNYNIGLVIVDSAALACGGDASEQTVATSYFNSLARLGVPSITIAHRTKDEEGTKYPFGSVFWHNSARATWYFEGRQPEPLITEATIHWRKSNDAGRSDPIRLTLDFSGYEEMTITPAADSGHKTIDRVEKALWENQGQEMTASEIAADLGESEDAVRGALRRLHKWGKVTQEGGGGGPGNPTRWKFKQLEEESGEEDD